MEENSAAESCNRNGKYQQSIRHSQGEQQCQSDSSQRRGPRVAGGKRSRKIDSDEYAVRDLYSGYRFHQDRWTGGAFYIPEGFHPHGDRHDPSAFQAGGCYDGQGKHSDRAAVWIFCKRKAAFAGSQKTFRSVRTGYRP